MDYLLELELCKVRNQLQRLTGNVYSNSELDSYQEKLFRLFSIISIEIKKDSANQASQKYIFTNIFEIISQSVQFLEDSTLNLIPFETVYCLEKVLAEWSNDDCILVTTFKRNEYAFDPSLSIQNSVNFDVIKYTYGLEFEKKLLQISIPKHEVNDYFFSAVLYHELAHYIDLKYKITENLINEEYAELEGEEKEEKQNHLREFFADIFSAQYISDTFLNFLELRAIEDGESFTHPSTSDRMALVEDFIDKESNFLLDQLRKATLDTTGNDLTVRYEKIDAIEDFFCFIPPVIKTDKQLHGLFVAGWDIWEHRKNEFKEPDSFKIYTYINNLIEKSISNYMIQSTWEKAKNNKVHVS